MKKYMLLLCSVLLLSQSCIMGQNKTEIFQNGKIDKKIKTTITTLNNEAYKHFCDNNYEQLSKMFTDSLRPLIGADFASKFMPAMQGIMKGRTYKVYDEFYIRHTKPGDTVNLSAGAGDEAYTVKLNTKTEETYLTMMLAGDSVDVVMLTVLYGNYKGKWQIYGITGEDYSLANRNAIAQYVYAQELERKDYLMDAVNVMSLSTHCINPGGRIFRFNKEQEMKTYADSLTSHTKAKYPFPYTVKEVATKPLVVNIHFEVDRGEFIPMIVYQSAINVQDTNSLAKENAQIQQNIGRIFNGMDKTNKRLFYRAYNQLPNGQNNPPYYNYIQAL